MVWVLFFFGEMGNGMCNCKIVKASMASSADDFSGGGNLDHYGRLRSNSGCQVKAVNAGPM